MRCVAGSLAGYTQFWDKGLTDMGSVWFHISGGNITMRTCIVTSSAKYPNLFGSMHTIM